MRPESLTPPPPVHIDVAQTGGKGMKNASSESIHQIVTPIMVRAIPKTPSPPPMAGAFTKALSSLAMPKSTMNNSATIVTTLAVTTEPQPAKRSGPGAFKRGFSLLGAIAGSKTVGIQTSAPSSAAQLTTSSNSTTAATTATANAAGHSPVPSCEELLDGSRPPSLITDNSSFTSSSRSPSPEPGNASISRLESSFKSYAASESPRILYAVLLPLLAATTTARSPLEDSEIGVLFKWWNHLLLVSRPSQSTVQAILAIARHPALIESSFWSAHYELTLSTIMCRAANVLPCHYFSRLLAVGYLYHAPTSAVLKALLSDPTKCRGDEPWAKRAKNVEVFVELVRSIYDLDSAHVDVDNVIGSRLEELIAKVVNVTTGPSFKLGNLNRLVCDMQGAAGRLLEASLIKVAMRIPVYHPVPCFYLMEFISNVELNDLDFWATALVRIVQSENHVLQIRAFALLYENWHKFSSSEKILDMLLGGKDGGQWEYFFAHWSGIVRDHYMRLLAYRVCATHPARVRQLLVLSFETSLQENCQLRDCLPGSPIPNKRFVIRPLTQKLQRKHLSQPGQHDASATSPTITMSSPGPPKELKSGEAPVTMFAYDAADEEEVGAVEYATDLIRKKLGMFRGLWSEESTSATMPNNSPSSLAPSMTRRPELRRRAADEDFTGESFASIEQAPQQRQSYPPSTTGSSSSSSSSTSGQQQPQPPAPQRFKFVQEFVGKQWSLTSDSDAIAFLDGVMDLAKTGRLPAYCALLPRRPDDQHDAEHDAAGLHNLRQTPYVLGPGRQQLWTRSLSEWSILLDDVDRFTRSSVTTSARRPVTPANGPAVNQFGLANCPLLEVEFPRWFVQRSTTIAGDGMPPQ